MIGEAKNDGRGADRHRRRPEKSIGKRKRRWRVLRCISSLLCTFWVSRWKQPSRVFCGGSARANVAVLGNTTMILFFFSLDLFFPFRSLLLLFFFLSTSLFSLSSHSRPPLRRSANSSSRSTTPSSPRSRTTCTASTQRVPRWRTLTTTPAATTTARRAAAAAAARTTAAGAGAPSRPEARRLSPSASLPGA